MFKARACALGALMFLLPGASLAETPQWPACGTVDRYPGAAWEPANAAAETWDTSALAEAKALFEELNSAAVMVVHRGHLIAQWGNVAERYTAQSVRKSLLNSLVGKLVADGRLSLDATLEELGIDDTAPPLSRSERQATVRDLLLSRSGIFHEALYEVGGWADRRLALMREELIAGTDKYGPGDYWIYNNWDFNALGTIVEAAAGRGIGPLFADWIAGPTGMQDFRAGDVEYTTKDSRAERYFRNWSEHRAYVFNISTRDLARYGLLFLGCGKWDGKAIVPRGWVLDSTTGVDTRQGRPADRQDFHLGDYGYLWWVDRPGSRRFESLKLSDPFYIASGNRGHDLFVFPALDLVIAHQVATVGGVGFAAQAKRAREGSPSVNDGDLARLVEKIVHAHPEAEAAFAAD